MFWKMLYWNCSNIILGVGKEKNRFMKNKKPEEHRKTFTCRQSIQHPEIKFLVCTLDIQLPIKINTLSNIINISKIILKTYTFLNGYSERRYGKCPARSCSVFKPPKLRCWSCLKKHSVDSTVKLRGTGRFSSLPQGTQRAKAALWMILVKKAWSEGRVWML